MASKLFFIFLEYLFCAWIVAVVEARAGVSAHVLVEHFAGHVVEVVREAEERADHLIADMVRVLLAVLIDLIVANAAKLVEVGTLHEQRYHYQKEQECAENGDARRGALAPPRDADGKAGEQPRVQH